MYILANTIDLTSHIPREMSIGSDRVWTCCSYIRAGELPVIGMIGNVSLILNLADKSSDPFSHGSYIFGFIIKKMLKAHVNNTQTPFRERGEKFLIFKKPSIRSVTPLRQLET